MHRFEVRQSATIVLSVTALAVPSASVWAASSRAAGDGQEEGHDRDQVVHRRAGSADRWGEVQVTLVVRKTTTTIGKHKTVKRHFVDAEDPRLPQPHRPVGVHQPAGAAVPHPGGPAGAERQRQHGRRAPPTRARASSARCRTRSSRRRSGEHARGEAAGRPRSSTSWGRRSSSTFGTRRSSASDLEPCLRLVSRGRPDLQHVQVRQRDQPPEPRRAVDPRGAAPMCGRCCSAASSSASRPTAPSTCGPLRATSTRPGYVKGWSVDRAAALLRELGAANFSINAGGDVLLAGAALPEPSWRVGVQHPLRAGPACEGRRGLASSRSRRRARTSGAATCVDPQRGSPPAGVLSVTVTGPELGTADAFATAAYALGEARCPVDANAPGSRLRGDDDPRRRRSSVDARVSRRTLSRRFPSCPQSAVIFVRPVLRGRETASRFLSLPGTERE